MTSEELLIRLAAIILLGVGAQWLASRVRLPSILLLLVFGFAAGRATGFIDPDELLGDLLVPAVSLAVAVILFEGGLGLKFNELRQVGAVVRNLITVGAVVTWAGAGLFGWLVLDLEPRLAVLLGAILVVTGPTVIVPLLEHIRPQARVGSILRWEGIVIDPLGAIVAVLAFEAVLLGEIENALPQATLGVVKAFGSGVGIGLLGAFVLVQMLRRYLVPDALENPVTLMVVVAVATGADFVQSEAGLLAATTMGIALANQRTVSVHQILEFKESLRVLLIGSLFVLLAARLEVDDLRSIGVPEAVFVVLLVLAVRPLAVALSTLRSPLALQERALLAWMAPRGIVAASVASIFALRLAEEGEGEAQRLVTLTFFAIVVTIALYGLTGSFVARRLGLAIPNPQGALIVGANRFARAIASALHSEGFEIALVDSNRRNVSDAQMAGLRASHVNVLSEEVSARIDLADLGYLVAVTPNDEVNSLAAQHFADLFGRARVYQLPAGAELAPGARDHHAIPHYLRGRLLFDTQASYDWLQQRLNAGAVVKVTNLTEEYDYDVFREHYGEDALPLFLIPREGRLEVISEHHHPTPVPGQRLVSLVDPVEEDEEATRAMPA